MGELPSGTVTFLFTDIEQSTQSVASLGAERYADVLESHRKLLREAFLAYKGQEVGTEGDAFFVAFARAGDAVSAAIQGQRALESHAWPDGARVRVRMGVHTGEAIVRGGDYVGHDVHKAKRICDAGHGGQILVSRTTAELVRSTTTLTDLGPHRLKDLGEPQPVYQVIVDGLRVDFPPLRSLDVARHNLPVQLTSFVGRERELNEVDWMLASNRLVTLTGVGGCGKTRLAVHAAGAQLEHFPHGVFFCDLSRISEEDAVPPAVATAVGIEFGADTGSLPTIEALRGYLGPRTALLVLDNCEHLIDATAALAEDLLTASAGLRILATSREALEVEGERTWSVPSLDVSADGTQLFVERATAVRAGFTLTEENTAAVHSICQRLDGMPLAIELAAAQVSHLSPRQIADRLDDRFMLLTGGRRRVQRQQTLQAAMEWSWELLDEPDRRLLARLGVFQGGFSLEGAESVCGDGLDVVRGLRSLVAKSLVVADDVGQANRYRLLETVRLYAEDKLAEAREVEQLRTRHRDYYLAWTKSMFDEFGPFYAPAQANRWLSTAADSLGDEQDNIRAALRWSEAQQRHDLVAQMLLWSFALWTYHPAEGMRRLEEAIETVQEPQERGRLLGALSQISIATGTARGEPRAYAEEAMLLLGEEPSVWLFLALQSVAVGTGIAAVATSDAEGAESAIAIAEHAALVGQTLDRRWAVNSHLSLAQVRMMLLRHIEAAQAYAACVREWPPDRLTTFQPVEGLHVARHIRRDAWTDELEAVLRVGTARCLGLGIPLYFLALDAVEEGRYDEAHQMIREYAGRMRGVAPPLAMRLPVNASGVIAAMVGDWERAARLLAAAMQPGIILSPSGYALYRHWLPRVREHLAPEQARRLRDEGRAMTLDEALDYAMAD